MCELMNSCAMVICYNAHKEESEEVFIWRGEWLAQPIGQPTNMDKPTCIMGEFVME